METVDLNIEYIVNGSGKWANHERTLATVTIKFVEFDEEMDCTLKASDPQFPHIERAWNKVVNLGEIGEIEPFDDSDLRAEQVSAIREINPDFVYDPELVYGDDGFMSSDDLAVILSDLQASAS